MKKTCICILLFSGMLLNGYAQKNDLNVYDYWSYYGDVSNRLYEHLYSLAFEQLNARSSFLSGLETEQDRQQYPAIAKDKLKSVMGLFPEKTPLNPVVTGKIKKEDFTVEKLYFESRPGYYVTAALFLPSKGKGKKPAILYCSGHSESGFRSAAYQRTILNLVKKGFIVLAFDPVGQGERKQYFDEKGKPVFIATHEHSYPGTQLFLSGVPLANYFVWDGIRAIDYLISRKEVDPQRIGITGRSGGGTQTAYIAAMDERILASAPECYITSYDMLLRSKGPQDAEQILPYYLKKGLDISDLIEIRAPKPTLMITTTSDMFSIQGARNVFKEAKGIYAACGQPDNLRMVEDDGGHVSTQKNREALYAFFQQVLNNPGDSECREVELFEEKDLWATPNGGIQVFKASETLFSLNNKQVDSVVGELKKKQAVYAGNTEYLRSEMIALTGFEQPQTKDETVFSGRIWQGERAIEKYLVKGAGAYSIPLLRLLPKGAPKETVLLLDDRGKSAAVNEGLANRLVEEGYEVVIPDLSGIGELGGGYKGGDAIIQGIPLNLWYAGVLTGKTPLAVRMEDMACVLDFISSLNKEPVQITGVACGTLTSDLLHSALVEKRFSRIALVNPLYSYLSLVREKEYRTKFIMSAVPGVIGAYDLPDLVSACSAEKKILIVNPVNALDERIDKRTFDESYVDGKSKVATFTVEMVDPAVLPSSLISWLQMPK